MEIHLNWGLRNYDQVVVVVGGVGLARVGKTLLVGNRNLKSVNTNQGIVVGVATIKQQVVARSKEGSDVEIGTWMMWKLGHG